MMLGMAGLCTSRQAPQLCISAGRVQAQTVGVWLRQGILAVLGCQGDGVGLAWSFHQASYDAGPSWWLAGETDENGSTCGSL